MSSPDLAELKHGANVLQALARNLQPIDAPVVAPLDHPSARDAVTLLAWRGTATSETLQFALGLSQPRPSGSSTGSSTPDCSRGPAPPTGASGWASRPKADGRRQPCWTWSASRSSRRCGTRCRMAPSSAASSPRSTRSRPWCSGKRSTPRASAEPATSRPAWDPTASARRSWCAGATSPAGGMTEAREETRGPQTGGGPRNRTWQGASGSHPHRQRHAAAAALPARRRPPRGTPRRRQPDLPAGPGHRRGRRQPAHDLLRDARQLEPRRLLQAVQLPQVWTFLTDRVGLDPSRIYVSCFIGDPAHGIPKDDRVGRDLDATVRRGRRQRRPGRRRHRGARRGGRHQGARIAFYGKKNWWCRGGGPTTCRSASPAAPTRGVLPLPARRARPGLRPALPPELRLRPLPRDRQLGLHGVPPHRDRVRPAAAQERRLRRRARTHRRGVDRQPDVFRINLLWPIIERLEALSGKTYDDETVAMRVIADHLRGAAFLAVGRRAPEQQGAGLRHAPAHPSRGALRLRARSRGELLPEIRSRRSPRIYDVHYPEVGEPRDDVIAVLSKEEHAFRRTLRKGLKQLRTHLHGGHRSGPVRALRHVRLPGRAEHRGGRAPGHRPERGWRAEFDEQMAAGSLAERPPSWGSSGRVVR